MNSNNKVDNNLKVININYKTAKESEKIGNYKKASILYHINITKYNDPLSKVRLAKLYLSGKTSDINNAYARKLLEEANAQGIHKGDALLAYSYANGIGGEKNTNKAKKLFLEEIKSKNPDSMVYIELENLLSRKNKNLKKSLKKCVTRKERRTYKRKVSIDKFNNTTLGMLVNKLPNKVATKFENFLEKRKRENLGTNLNNLFEKAQEYKAFGKEDYARRIFKRLSNYGDKASQLEYAKMCLNGIGGTKNIEEARAIYANFCKSRNNKLHKIKENLKYLEEKKLHLKYNNNNESLKLIENIDEKIIKLKNIKSKILSDNKYNEAVLNYGILLVDNYNNDFELEKGIKILKSIAKNGEKILSKNERLTKLIRLRNMRAQKAILKLGELYKKNKWNPKNLDNEREMFCKFSTSKISKYTNKISNAMKYNIKSNLNNIVVSSSKNNYEEKFCIEK